jgi:transcription antitermination factor NusG
MALLALTGFLAYAQTATRLVGAITSINGSIIEVKTDAGETSRFSVPSTASIRRVAPGETNLERAQQAQLSDLAVGDRVLVRLDANAQGATPQAASIVAIKQQDVKQAQERLNQAWQRGAAGLVKSVDAASGAIVISSGAGASAKTVTVHTTKATLLKRYAPNSISYEQARAAGIDQIQPGDQLRARGNKNADGTEIDADEVVSGTFRNVSGTVTSVDSAASALEIKDLATKKQVTVHISSDTQMHKLPENMAQMLAARLKSGSSASQVTMSARPNAGPGSFGAGRAQGEGDVQQMLNRAPAIQISDLKKGDAVMLVTTPGTTDVNGITLLAGVDALLEAPESQNLLSTWSLNSGAGSSGGDASQ